MRKQVRRAMKDDDKKKKKKKKKDRELGPAGVEMIDMRPAAEPTTPAPRSSSSVSKKAGMRHTVHRIFVRNSYEAKRWILAIDHAIRLLPKTQKEAKFEAYMAASRYTYLDAQVAALNTRTALVDVQVAAKLPFRARHSVADQRRLQREAAALALHQTRVLHLATADATAELLRHHALIEDIARKHAQEKQFRKKKKKKKLRSGGAAGNIMYLLDGVCPCFKAARKRKQKKKTRKLLEAEMLLLRAEHMDPESRAALLANDRVRRVIKKWSFFKKRLYSSYLKRRHEDGDGHGLKRQKLKPPMSPLKMFAGWGCIAVYVVFVIFYVVAFAGLYGPRVTRAWIESFAVNIVLSTFLLRPLRAIVRFGIMHYLAAALLLPELMRAVNATDEDGGGKNGGGGGGGTRKQTKESNSKTKKGKKKRSKKNKTVAASSAILKMNRQASLRTLRHDDVRSTLRNNKELYADAEGDDGKLNRRSSRTRAVGGSLVVGFDAPSGGGAAGGAVATVDLI